jgi:hypothetical protein
MKIPLWCPFGAVIGGKDVEDLLVRPHSIQWCIVENWTTNADLTWIERLHERCGKSGTALFVNGIGQTPVFEGKPVALKDGSAAGWNEWPERLRIRELPPKVISLRSHETGPNPRPAHGSVRLAGNEILALDGIREDPTA